MRISSSSSRIEKQKRFEAGTAGTLGLGLGLPRGPGEVITRTAARHSVEHCFRWLGFVDPRHRWFAFGLALYRAANGTIPCVGQYGARRDGDGPVSTFFISCGQISTDETNLYLLS